jgi:hypothetical protein
VLLQLLRQYLYLCTRKQENGAPRAT